MRLVWIALALAVVLLVPFLIWGDRFEEWFTGDAAIDWVRSWGAWGGLAVIGLLIADLVLPLPATGVMSASGYLYGFWLGGTMNAIGSILSGILAYGLCRSLGRGVAEKLAGRESLAREEALFHRRGPVIVALSRWLPLLPEVVACLAGLTRMPLRSFVIALACGSIPMAFAYAAIGAAGQSRPGMALGLSILAPAVCYAIARPWLRGAAKQA